MVALAVPSSVAHDILAWMHEAFDGTDLRPVAERAARRAVDEGWISGPLWEEIGATALIALYRTDMIRHPRHTLRNLMRRVPDVISDETTEAIYSQPVYVNGAWVEFGELTKAHCWAVSDAYQEQIAPLEEERDYYAALGEGFGKDKAATVATRYTVSELIAIRARVTKR